MYLASWINHTTLLFLLLSLLSCGRIGFEQLPVEIDDCPEDDQKTHPGVCGCGISENDTDGDGTPDCFDDCPTDPTKTDNSICDCGIPDIDSDRYLKETNDMITARTKPMINCVKSKPIILISFANLTYYILHVKQL